ncbi:MAG: OmpW/AlkL family protein [Burkholderiales bacterium]
MRNLTKSFATLLIAASTVSATPALQAASEGFVARLRVIDIEPDVSSDIGGLDVDNKVSGEVGLTYFLTPNWAADLGIATAKHDITLNGANIGSAKILPVNLIAQYHFGSGWPVRPYVGAGVNYTRFSDTEIAGGAIGLDSSSFGPVLQVGVDWPVTDVFFVNADLKKIWIGTDATGAASGKIDIDPWVFGVGVGFKF